MNKACILLIVALSPASLFAGETMVTHTTAPASKCNFRLEPCETSVATDPSYLRFKDGSSIPGPADVTPAQGDSGLYHPPSFTYQDYPAPQHPTIDELLAQIQDKLNKVNCPRVTFTFDEATGDITLRYVESDCDCRCDWTVNIRDVKADDFVWKRTKDNYSPRLGQMERRKFHTASAQDAQDIETDFARINTLKGWTTVR